MTSLRRSFVLISACLVSSVTFAQQPTWFPHRTDLTNIRDTSVGLGATGLFTQSITNQTNVPHQAETGSMGFLLSFRDHPVHGVNVEVNYQYSSYTERFTSQVSQKVTNVPLSFHEFTAGYIFQSQPDRFHPLKPLPFVVVGGGELYFNPSPVHVNTQLRPTGLVETGVDLASFNSHVTYRFSARALPYRAPNFNRPDLATSAWHVTVEPAINVVLHY